MSSSLNQFVPVFNGTNYREWAPAMQAYLMSAGQWKATKPSALPPAAISIKDEAGTEVVSNQSEINDWEENAEKAMGNIRLRLNENIRAQYLTEEYPSTLWNKLHDKYGVVGIPTAFIEFKGLMDTVIPNGSDPNPAIDKILTHYTRLTEMRWKIDSEIVAMILLSKAPPSMESVVQMTTMLGKGKDGKEDVRPTLDRVVLAMTNSWETNRRQGNKVSQNQQRANKLSAVKPWNQQSSPQFQQQQQQDAQQQQDGNKKGRRGKRGGRKNNQQQLQSTTADDVAPQQQQAQQPTFIPPPNPQFQFQAGPSGFFSRMANHVQPSVTLPPPPTPKGSTWKTFNKALNLAHSLGVTPTIETLRTLEMPLLQAEEKMAKRPNKRPRRETTISKPVGIRSR